jgi:DNA polymerase-3 subunit delta'
MPWERAQGREEIIRALERAWQQGRLAHAYLLLGPTGVGKRTFAQELAQALLCEQLPCGPERGAARLAACRRCAACHLVQAGTHPDLYSLSRDPESNEVSIDQLRELMAHFQLTAARGRGKIAILGDADDWSEAAANCFLKTLEEPPPGSLFLLVGSSRDRLLPTIVSRCQILPFPPLPQSLVENILRQQGLEPTQAARLARLSQGCPGQALALAEAALWQWHQRLLEGLARTPFNSVALARDFLGVVEQAGKETAAQRRRAALLLQLLLFTLHDTLQVKVGGTPRVVQTENLPQLQRLAESLTEEQLLWLIERCLEADEQLRRYIQIALVIEGLLDALAQVVQRQGAAAAR